MDQTPNLLLPYILAAQSQKHVTHNEALRALDNVVQLTVLDRNLAAPPATPAEGNRYIVAPSPTGTWAGHANHIAAFVDGAWLWGLKRGHDGARCHSDQRDTGGAGHRGEIPRIPVDRGPREGDGSGRKEVRFQCR